MGGRGGSSGLSGQQGIVVGQTITMNGYKIKEGVVESPSGNRAYVDNFRNLTDAEKRKMKDALEEAGIKDPVSVGRLLMPRVVAEAAIRQRKLENEALKKNVPGLDELISASESDASAKRNYRRQFESESGAIRGISPLKYKSVAQKYPAAAAYLKAEKYYMSNNAQKSAIGKEAMNKIASGRSADKVIREMEKKWKKMAESKKWD